MELVMSGAWCISGSAIPGSREGESTMCGVRNISSSVRLSALPVERNNAPRIGMSPRNGTLLVAVLLLLEMRPPMTTVWPLGVTTTVSAERMLSFGANTGAPRMPPVAISWPGEEPSTADDDDGLAAGRDDHGVGGADV